MDYIEELKKKFPVGQTLNIKGYKFIITRRYARGRYKIKLQEKSRLDFTGETFVLKSSMYKLIKKTNEKTYIVKKT